MWIITGATGFIGSQFVRLLNEAGYENIIMVDYIPPSQRLKTTQNLIYEEFIPAEEFLKNLSKYTSATWVIHMGANSSTTESNWETLKKQNLDYSKTLWNWCSENKVGFIYASSAATYGGGEKGYSDQTPPQDLKTLNLYGESKRLFDLWAVEQASNKVNPPHWWGLKFFNVYGPGEFHKESMASVVYKSFFQISKTGQLALFKSHDSNFKDGEQKRDFVYVKDITRWMKELIDKRPPSQIFNMGFGQARTWLDLAQVTFQALDKKANIHFIDIPPHIREQYQYFTEAEMSQWNKLQLSPPQWPIEKAVPDYIQNYLIPEFKNSEEFP